MQVRAFERFIPLRVNGYGSLALLCFVCGFTSQSTGMVTLRRSVNLTTLFVLGKIDKNG